MSVKMCVLAKLPDMSSNSANIGIQINTNGAILADDLLTNRVSQGLADVISK